MDRRRWRAPNLADDSREPPTLMSTVNDRGSCVPADEHPRSPPPPYEEISNRPTASPQHLSVYYQQQFQADQYPRPGPSGALCTNPGWPFSTLNMPTAHAPTINQPSPDSMFHLNEGVTTRSMNQGAALCDRVASRLNDVLSRLDRQSHPPDGDLEALVRELAVDDGGPESQQSEQRTPHDRSDGVRGRPMAGVISFKKPWMYANSRLPPQMLPFKVYVPTWSIFCRAADASMAVYNRPKGHERQDYVDADWRQGTKAMALKSVCLDEHNLIVFAIRGSKWNLFDWAVNFRPAPTEPVGFLDDVGNACHAGFLHVAKAMVPLIASRLRQLLEQDSGRAGSSLVLTGHSAGGAVASLLYMHMVSTLVESELNVLTGCFRRLHCITFGSPPVSLLPLQNPSDGKNRKNIFVAFANEGDLVVRADKQYIASLCRLIASPTPVGAPSKAPSQELRAKASRQRLKRSVDQRAITSYHAPWWPVPDATLSNAGRMVLLRNRPARQQTIEATCVSDEELRNVMFGDPSMHDMALYRQRIDELAIAAVTGREGS